MNRWMQNAAGLLWAALLAPAQACSCMSPPPLEQQVRDAFDARDLIVLVEITGHERRRASLAFTAEHLLGEVSPWRGEEFIQARILRSWTPGFQSNQRLEIRKLGGAACGYEDWENGKRHLLFMTRLTWWVAGLCGPSQPESKAAELIRLLDAEAQRRAARQTPVQAKSASRP
ncbi:hypothetical protein [Inhella sp.]|uniref:hypothetical protein n=1 Tax=Inhella sp. TaxID=1921806 RepID=UPI0035AE34CF